MFDRLFRKRGSICEQVGFHSFQYHYGWNVYVCQWCGKTIRQPKEGE